MKYQPVMKKAGLTIIALFSLYIISHAQTDPRFEGIEEKLETT